ncbi:MAG: alpha/beta fold hydrolase [Pseudomonadota bacterium]|nr:alpha/beta fold hydrolase [Pseudomonadota bacterium]
MRKVNTEERQLWEEKEPNWPNHTFSRFVEAGGIRWHVQQAGNGPTLLLIHGTGASTHSWRDLIPILARRYTVVAPDLPGHAFTDSVTGAQSSIRGMCDLLTALLQELRFTPEYCVGHSAGAVILCQLALMRRIEPRVIVSINGAFLPLRGFSGMAFSLIAKLFVSNSFVPRLIARRASDSARVERVLARTGSRIDAEGLGLYTRLVREPRHLTGTLRMLTNWNLYQFERELPRLRTPLVLIVAENDRAVSPQQASTVRQRVANASIVLLPSLGHLAHEEAPAMLAAQINQICVSHHP